MTLKIKATPTFVKSIKKLHDKDKKTVDDPVHEILAKPTIGETKIGVLSGVRVYKFKINTQEILLAYSVDPDMLLLIARGTHENFYRNPK